MSPRRRRIDQHDIEVARQPAMLKAVIEHQHFALQLLDGGTSQGDAVGPLQVRHVRQVLFQHQRLVIAAARAAVAATEDGHAAIEAAIEAGDILDAGRLAGAAGRQVADADDRHRHARAAQPAAPIGEVPQPHSKSVGHTGGAQAQALQRRPETARLAGKQTQIMIAWAAAHAPGRERDSTG